MEPTDFDLVPSPRVLAVLGDIDLDIWRCLAELIDNSVDGFLGAHRNDKAVESPRVTVSVPTSNDEKARITVVDNGPGMDLETLQNAMKAGWTSNSPLENLGLYGLGFNIATARLGRATEVWTTREGDSEWHGLRIDFDQLTRQRHFRTPHLTRAKPSPDIHGTELIIERLNRDPAAWLAKPYNRTKVRRQLEATYSSMLRAPGQPIKFELWVGTVNLQGRRHCVWDEQRFVEMPDVGTVHAVEQIDISLGDRAYCVDCRSWVASLSEKCPVCESEGTVVNRKRRVRGWIGVQRYLDTQEYGLDFIRNGRKIETGNKDLFTWISDDFEEKEYPYDDPRGRGRFVGEIHIDHCRVNYVKNGFDRNDPSWREMVSALRGDAPMRRDRVKNLGYPPNATPLARIFRAFQRSNVREKGGVGWKRILVVDPHERAQEMAHRYHEGDPEYQTDEKWWELVCEQDRIALEGPSDDSDDGGPVGPDGFDEGSDDDDEIEGEVSEDPIEAEEIIEVQETAWPSLSQEYFHEQTGLKWKIEAFSTSQNSPGLSEDLPWVLSLISPGEDLYKFTFLEDAPVFRSMNMDPLDALLAQLAWQICEVSRGRPDEMKFSSALSDLRNKYAVRSKIDPAQIVAEAEDVFIQICRSVSRNCSPGDGRALFDELGTTDQQSIVRRMAQLHTGNPQQTIDAGAFLEYAPRKILPKFVDAHPEYFFDGKFWDDPFETLDYGDLAITNESRMHTLSRYLNLLSEAVWLVELDVTGLEAQSRDVLVRAAYTLRLLRPDIEPPA